MITVWSRLVRGLLGLAWRVCGVYWRLISPRTIGVRALMLDGAGRVLLVRHGYARKRWHMPGGGIKRRETLTDAVRREIGEETGLQVTAADAELRLLGTYSSFAEGKSDHISVFIVPPGAWQGTLRASGVEITAAGFFPLDDLPAEVSAGTRRRLAELRDGSLITHRW